MATQLPQEVINELTRLHHERGTLKRTLTILESKLTKDTISHALAKSIQTQVMDIEDRFSPIHRQLEELTKEYAEQYAKEDREATALYERCIDAKLKASEFLYPHSSQESVATNANASVVNNDLTTALTNQTNLMRKMLELQTNNTHTGKMDKLPQLSLPTFDGNYTDWVMFRDAFLNTIHNNNSLKPHQKMQYLKMSLTGDAAEHISHVQTSDDNYEPTWARVVHRYQRRIHLVNALIKQFLALTKEKVESVSELRNSSRKYRKTYDSLKALGSDCFTLDTVLIFLMKLNMSERLRTKWEEGRDSETMPVVEQFFEFMDEQTDVLERSAQENPKHSDSSYKGANKPKGTIKSHHTEMLQCVKCGAAHALYQCDQYKALSIDDRRTFIAKASLCFNCLGNNHSSKKCMSKSRCRECGKAHHTTIHIRYQPQVPPVQQQAASVSHAIVAPPPQFSGQFNNQMIPSQSGSSTGSGPPLFTAHQTYDHPRALLPTALVYIPDIYGVKRKCRILIDGGGECTMISENCAQRLSLPRHHARIPVTGAGGASVGITRGLVNLEMMSVANENPKIKVQALIMLKLCSELPSVPLSPSTWSHLQGLQLADPDFHSPAKIDIILGAEYASEIELGEIIRGNEGEPLAKLTIFGWIVTGRISAQPEAIRLFHTHADTKEILKRFWEVETIQPTKSSFTEDEKQCEAHFAATHSRDSTGRYVVKLPFKPNHEDLGDSTPAALARLNAMERRFARDPAFHQAYKEFMAEYLAMGHMEVVPRQEVDKPDREKYLIPHQAVVRPNSETTKLRVVFDASVTTKPNNPSLNSILETGPTIQADLLGLLLRFRTHLVAFTADVEKMYRQILVSEEDRDYQRILWRTELSQRIQVIRLNTVTYGTRPAPFLAIRVLHQIAYDHQSEFPAAAQSILTSFYMDDLLCGASTVAEGKQLRRDIQEVLNRGHFPLRKWSSNSEEILQDIPTEMLAITPDEMLNQTKSISALGLKWCPAKDTFSLMIETPPPVYTMRDYCSAAAKSFDPLGFITPVIVRFKMGFQSLWTYGLDWDNDLPPEVVADYEKMQSQFILLKEIEVPRIIPSKNGVIELYGFSDASERGYGAVIYAKGLDEAAQVKVNLVIAKSRVAPLKPLTIPRLELNGCLILAQIIEKVKEALSDYEVRVHAWTDSMICLQWLKDDPRKWKTYVCNRTSIIQDVIPPEQWHHVRTDDNPADCISRGLFPEELMKHHLWWHGPQWLEEDENQWPVTNIITKKKTEEERSMIIHMFTKSETNPLISHLLNKYSGYMRVVRITAMLLRFIKNARLPSEQRYGGVITVEEQDRAKEALFAQIQRLYFPEEYKRLSKGKPIPPNSKLKRLVPFMDKSGVIRALGRIKNAQVSERTRHPIILPNKHPLIRRLVYFTHLSNYHASNQLTIGILCTRYHILGIRFLVTDVRSLCIPCIKAKPQTLTPLMAQLPEYRVEKKRAFYRSGCDYAGPFQIRTSYLRKAPIVKGYICIFVCMVTKAVHLELVSDMSTEKFVKAFTRFTSRRGKCKHCYCDNGSNFIGASGLSREERLKGHKKNQDKICRELAVHGTQFHFIPPYAPTFGGLWERGVGNVKTHLKRVLGDQVLTSEDFRTVLCGIEACLNSRPLCAMTTDPEDLEPLTPAHFWLGHTLTLEPTEDYTTEAPNRLTNYKLLQRYIQQFWNRWHLEYLTSLMERPKWYKECESLKVSDLVLVRESNLRPSVWKLGRVIEIHPGKDNVVRVVTLRTENGDIKRAVNTLAKLPVE